jgi:hypothetical protein
MVISPIEDKKINHSPYITRSMRFPMAPQESQIWRWSAVLLLSHGREEAQGQRRNPGHQKERLAKPPWRLGGQAKSCARVAQVRQIKMQE